MSCWRYYAYLVGSFRLGKSWIIGGRFWWSVCETRRIDYFIMYWMISELDAKWEHVSVNSCMQIWFDNMKYITMWFENEIYNYLVFQMHHERSHKSGSTTQAIRWTWSLVEIINNLCDFRQFLMIMSEYTTKNVMYWPSNFLSWSLYSFLISYSERFSDIIHDVCLFVRTSIAGRRISLMMMCSITNQARRPRIAGY